jgi:predicted metal-dependent hydrolase
VSARERSRGAIDVDGLRVELRRKAVRAARLHVEASGLVWLSLPLRFPEAEAVDLIRRRRVWLDLHLRRFAEARQSVTLWGEPLDDAVAAAALDRLYRAEIEQRTRELAAAWEPVVGRSALGWRFRWMRSRWGSCRSATRQITINVALAAHPPEYLEQVIVHELVHLWVAAHNAEFNRRMDQLLPRWRAIRREMRRIAPTRPGDGSDRVGADPTGADRHTAR